MDDTHPVRCRALGAMGQTQRSTKSSLNSLRRNQSRRLHCLRRTLILRTYAIDTAIMAPQHLPLAYRRLRHRPITYLLSQSRSRLDSYGFHFARRSRTHTGNN
jgi:hypothetical protein